MAELTLSAILAADAVPGLTRAFTQDKSVFAIAEEGLCAVLWRPSSGLLFGGGKRLLGEQLVKAQQILEAAQQAGPVLGAAAGQQFRSEEQARRFVALNAPELHAALQQFGDMRQQQVVVRWDPQGALVRFQENAEVAKALEAVSRERTPAAGALLQSAMEGRRVELAQAFRAVLQDAVHDLLDLPLDGPDMLLNVAAAIVPGGEASFDAALQRIDSTWSEGLKIKVIGPLPAISFAAVTVDRFESERLVEARRRLGVGEAASPEEVERAFRALVKTSHPDLGGDSGKARALVDARDLLVRLAGARRQADPRDLASSGLVRLQRDGAAQRAA